MALSKSQKAYFRSTLEHIDKLISDCEQILAADVSPNLFEEYIPDLTSFEKERTKDGVARLRESMKRALQSQSIEMVSPLRVGSRRALVTAFHFIDISLQELMSHYMRGYGNISDEDSRELDIIVPQMRGMVQDIRSRLAPEAMTANPKPARKGV